jgi:hypothetical protein
MRALGLGVVIQTGPGSKFKVGDAVTGPFGIYDLYYHLVSVVDYTGRLDRIRPYEGQGCPARPVCLHVECFRFLSSNLDIDLCQVLNP